MQLPLVHSGPRLTGIAGVGLDFASDAQCAQLIGYYTLSQQSGQLVSVQPAALSTTSFNPNATELKNTERQP